MTIRTGGRAVAALMVALAASMAHASGGFWPTVNQGETAVLYCFAFLYMAARGSGRWSVDGMRQAAPAPRR